MSDEILLSIDEEDDVALLNPDEHPERLKVGGVVYKLYRADKITIDGVNECRGLCLYKQHEIYVARDENPSAFADILLHELVHACSERYALGLDEEQVTRLSAILVDLFYNNPYLIEALGGGFDAQHIDDRV